jgi:hypothetical protein
MRDNGDSYRMIAAAVGMQPMTVKRILDRVAV